MVGAVLCALDSILLARYASSARMQFGLDGRAGLALLAGSALGASPRVRLPRSAAWLAAAILVILPATSFSYAWWGTVGYALVTATTCCVIVEAIRRGSALEKLEAYSRGGVEFVVVEVGDCADDAFYLVEWAAVAAR